MHICIIPIVFEYWTTGECTRCIINYVLVQSTTGRAELWLSIIIVRFSFFITTFVLQYMSVHSMSQFKPGGPELLGLPYYGQYTSFGTKRKYASDEHILLTWFRGRTVK